MIHCPECGFQCESATTVLVHRVSVHLYPATLDDWHKAAILDAGAQAANDLAAAAAEPAT